MSSGAKVPMAKLRGGEETPLEGRAGRLLKAARPVEAWPTERRQESWRRIAQRAGEPSRAGLWLGLAGAVGAFAVVTAVVLSRREAAAPIVPEIAAAQARVDLPPVPAAPGHVDLGALGSIEIGEDTVYELLPAPAHPSATVGQSLRLSAGRLCAVIRHRDPAREGPFTVLAPKLRVVDVGTRFCVEVVAGRTAVDVSEGEVRVEGEGGRNVEVVAGQRVASDDARLRAPVPSVGAAAPVASAPVSCESLRTLEAREACETEASAGDGLAAQNALYNLALLARDQRHDGATALTLFQTYRHRFPQGALAPEASLGILTELSQEGRYGDAATEASQYVQAYPGESKSAQVGLILGNLQRERLDNPAGARAAYERVLRAAPEPEIAGEALFGLALSELKLGQRSEAEASLRRYLAEHPTGARAADATRLLGR